MTRSAALTALILFAASSQAAAQRTGEVLGRVVDAASQAPLGTAAVDVTVPGAPTPTASSTTLRVIDPFNTSRELNTITDPGFTQVSNRRRVIRGLLLNINWIFGTPERRGRDDLIGNESGAP